MNPDHGRFRYVLTRPCLDRGALTLLRYLEPAFPKDGTVVFVADAGQEIEGRVDPVAGRITGLGDYLARQHLNVNDTLVITSLGERRYQLEALPRSRAEGAPDVRSARSPLPPLPQRVVVEENQYVREVREVRVAPYPRGLVARPAERAPETPAPAPAAQAPAPVEPARPSFAPARPEPLPAASLEAAASAFARLGYRVERLPDGALRLGAELGRRAYAVRLTSADAPLEPAQLTGLAEAARASRARHAAIIAPEKITAKLERPAESARVALVTREALEGLLEVARLAPIGPLELEGYWNAGSISPDSVESLRAGADEQVAARGAFSFVTLSLARFEPHSVVSAKDVGSGVGGAGIGQAAVAEVLETLSRAPFMLLASMGGGEYYLRQPVATSLAQLADYASSLRARLRPQAVGERVGAGLVPAERA